MLLLLIPVLLVIGLVSVLFSFWYRNNMGYNVGEKHMKEYWGLDEHKEYHE